MSLAFSPIAPWPIMAVLAIAVMGPTLWAYHARLRGTSGRWQWLALGLRLAAVLLTLFGAARPAAVVLKKVKQAASVVFLVDASESMGIADEAAGRSRWNVARSMLDESLLTLKKRAPSLDVKVYLFDAALSEFKSSEGDAAPPKGKETGIGSALEGALARQNGVRIASAILLSDGASNAGPSPLAVAARLGNLQVPVNPVCFGTAGAGAASRDLAAREVVTAPTAFVKNEVEVRGTIGVRGYPNQDIEVELFVEGFTAPVATKKVRAPEGTEIVALSGLKFTPQSDGEKKVTLRVKPKEGELVPGNNEVSTFVTVLRGGLNVLYIQGPNFSWEFKFLTRALDAADYIQTDLKVLREPAGGDRGDLVDADLAPGAYDVYILGDLPADYLTRSQQLLLARAVDRKAGLMMLGGRSSFGEGGWAGTPIGDLLPVVIRPGDGQNEPAEGLKVLANEQALDEFVLQLGPTRAESRRLWDALPPIPGANRFSRVKAAAILLARTPSGDALMAGLGVGKGRALAFGGETWVWARAGDEARAAHRKFWRQAILWLAHKEDEGQGQIKLLLDHRRVAVGQKVEMAVAARGAKGEPMPDAKFETSVTFLGPNGKAEPVTLYNQGAESRGSFYGTREPGEYRVAVSGTDQGKDIGRDSARFLVYQDDRELSNPAADPELLKQIAEITGGKPLVPEQLEKYLATLDDEKFTSFERQTEYRLWDNWPFLLIFTALLSAEWWLRKRKGWV